MTIITCRPDKRKHVDLYGTLKTLSTNHPQIKAMIDQVKESHEIDQLDKKMIEQQLLSMAGTLNESSSYTLVLNRWRGGNPLSSEREQVFHDQRTIRDETIFTIVAGGRKKNWTVFVDLPIDIDLPDAKLVTE